MSRVVLSAAPPKLTVTEAALLWAAGWQLGPHDKWFNTRHDRGDRYCNTPRAFRYIHEEYGDTLEPRADEPRS